MENAENKHSDLSKSPADAPDQLVSTSDGSYRLSEWLGAIFFYTLHLRKEPFSNFYHKKYEKRNFLAGYVLMIGGLILVLVLITILK